MGAGVTIELNHEGFESLLKSGEVESLLTSEAQSIVARCGEGYSCETVRGSKDGRIMVYVHPDTDEALVDEATNKTMEKVVNG